MKLKSLLFFSIISIAGCASYEHPDEAPYATLSVTSSDMSVKKNMTDDMTIIRMNQNNGKAKKLLGVLRIPAKDSSKSFKIPVDKMELHVIVNFAFIGAAASCETYLKINADENERFELQVEIGNDDKSNCLSRISNKEGTVIDEDVAEIDVISF